MEIGDRIKVYKNYMGLKSNELRTIKKIEGNNIWVTAYEFPFSLSTGLYSQMTIDGFKIYIVAKRNLNKSSDK